MEHITYTTTNKTTWPRGPWDNEPDKEQWPDPTTGLPCLIKRGPQGAWCGYVGLPPNHPWYGYDYTELNEYIDVHGGLTYSDHCQDGDDTQTICHTPGPGEPDHLWWIGFDAGHHCDYSPALVANLIAVSIDPAPVFRNATYRSADYMRAQCAHLAAQVAAIDTPTHQPETT